jgi:hypothetical protein
VVDHRCHVVGDRCDVVGDRCDVVGDRCDWVEDWCDWVEDWCDWVEDWCDLSERRRHRIDDRRGNAWCHLIESRNDDPVDDGCDCIDDRRRNKRVNNGQQ